MVTDPYGGLIEKILVQPGQKAWISETQIDTIERTYARYIATCERQFFRALHELQRVQSIRKGIKPTSIAVDFLNDNKTDD